MKSLDDVFEMINAEGSYQDFVDALDEALKKLPISRESAVKVMDAIEQYDILELYNALFDSFEEFLMEEEKTKVIARYKKTFDLSMLPWWAEE